MARDGIDHPDTVGLYEIGLDSDVCDAMRRANPEARVAAARTSTVLWSWLQRRDELYALLDRLADFGLTPREIHLSAGGSTPIDTLGWVMRIRWACGRCTAR